MLVFFFFKQKTAYEMRISDWSSDVCSSDLDRGRCRRGRLRHATGPAAAVRGAVGYHAVALPAHVPRGRPLTSRGSPGASAVSSVETLPHTHTAGIIDRKSVV